MFKVLVRRLAKKPVEFLPEDRVKLPVILGIRPGHYLAALYAIAVLAVLFFIFCYPGISHPGSLGVFQSEPSGAAVRIDGVTLGYTPCELFLPKGKHRAEFVLPGFTFDVRELDVGSRLAASRFFPRRLQVNGVLSTPDPAGAFALSALEYIRWSFFNEATEAFQVPLSLSEGAYRTGPGAKNPQVHTTINGIVKASLRYARNKSSLRDLARAWFLADNGGQSPSPLTLVHSIQDMFGQINTEALSWLEGFLPEETGGFVPEETIQPEKRTIRPVSRLSLLSLSGVVFIPVDTLPGGIIPDSAAGSSFYIASAPVSQSAWDAFTAEVPSWAVENRDTLEARRLVGEDYLFRPDTPAYPDPAVPGISWYAAEAWCAWLTGKLPPSLSGWEVRLPAEAEWDAVLGSPEEDSRDRWSSGLLWEWCADTYAPFPFFPISEEARILLEKAAEDDTSFGMPEKTLRGGSWINPYGSVSAASRGSLPAETSSPFAGFRPVIAPKPGSR